ncbi:hypothetical protein GXM_05761 [Nostoc sphaeroides CCNUC1]|uniref:Uncharacterized protein n=1 Tax=Nostoc sphaeroides CCNUC1 TaxID=2653204 RepID=A0A5P8W8I6_9NOSO|nr:hypothetical protein GXM_05761 [Nostoc sphaeroides CCNUC1]
MKMQKGVGIEPSASKSASEVAILCRKLLNLALSTNLS